MLEHKFRNILIFVSDCFDSQLNSPIAFSAPSDTMTLKASADFFGNFFHFRQFSRLEIADDVIQKFIAGRFFHHPFGVG